jgi:hypothetical protein
MCTWLLVTISFTYQFTQILHTIVVYNRFLVFSEAIRRPYYHSPLACVDLLYAVSSWKQRGYRQSEVLSQSPVPKVSINVSQILHQMIPVV